jgi:hypothetical protein
VVRAKSKARFSFFEPRGVKDREAGLTDPSRLLYRSLFSERSPSIEKPSGFSTRSLSFWSTFSFPKKKCYSLYIYIPVVHLGYFDFDIVYVSVVDFVYELYCC